MATAIFICPNTAQHVQGWFADDGSDGDGEVYESVTCLACRQLHLVNLKSGKVLGGDDA
jgi:hypothetical protein